MSEVVGTAQQGLAGKYPPYPEYKDSGVEWLQLCPSSWETKALKYIVSCNDEVLSESTDPDMEFEYIDIGGVSSSEGITRTESMRFSGAPSRARRIVRQGDIIVSTVRTYLEAIAPISLEFDGKIASTGFAVLRPKYLLSGFAKYALRARHFIDSVVARSTGVSYPAINSSELIDIKIVVPSLKEQQTIASFLDYETARIDRLIAQQQRLIELLKEKRQAVISHAVTKGLNPDAPMKDSGVEWIGQVPEHWQCVPFGLLVSRADLGGNYLGGQEENGIPFLKMGNLGRGCIVLDKLECLEEGSSFDDSHRLSMGDFLFNTRNSLDLVGKVAVWHDELEFALYNSNLLRVRFKKDFISSPDFMGFVFNSSGALGWLALLAKGTTSVAAIYYKDLRSMVVPIPPVDEQNAISSFISKCLSRLDTLEEKAIQSINLMNERRTALISAAVTGKIDLRGWTTPADEVAV